MSTTPVKVLLIDDSEFTLKVQSDLLRAHGFDTRAASTLERFDQLLADWSPDIILSDVQMPGLTGVELCQLLKNRYETAHVPIVLLSSLPEEELAVLAQDCNADAYLSKADGLEHLAEELRLLCESIDW